MTIDNRVLQFPASSSRATERAQCPNCFTLNSVWHLEQKNRAKTNGDDSVLRCALCGTQLANPGRADNAKAA